VVEFGERAVGLVELADQQQSPGFHQPRVRGVAHVVVLFERCASGIERLRGPVELARGERDFGLSHDATRARNRFVGAEGTRCTPHQRSGASEIAELRHRNAAQCQRRRVVAQCDAVQRAERITRRKCTRGGRDQ
jgi:hypothetical protein